MKFCYRKVKYCLRNVKFACGERNGGRKFLFGSPFWVVAPPKRSVGFGVRKLLKQYQCCPKTLERGTDTPNCTSFFSFFKKFGRVWEPFSKGFQEIASPPKIASPQNRVPCLYFRCLEVFRAQRKTSAPEAGRVMRMAWR